MPGFVYFSYIILHLVERSDTDTVMMIIVIDIDFGIITKECRHMTDQYTSIFLILN